MATTNSPLDRRRFLGAGVGLVSAMAAGGFTRSRASEDEGLIAGIERELIFPGREGKETTWFHPRPCVIPGKGGAEALMTLQDITGSDVFGHVHWTISKDQGRTWSAPEPIPGLGRDELGDNWQVGVCDVVPQFHPQSGTVLAVGHNVYYKNGVLANPQRARWPVYLVRSADGTWSKPQKLEWDDPRGSAIYTCGCSERLVLDDGDVLMPLSYGPEGRVDRMVTSARCSFDGQELKIRAVGSELVNKAGRGLLEPSLAFLDGRYYMTIRAEDERGYVSTSEDGLNWEPQRAWTWDDGEPLVMSTTQQHWLTHSDGLFLVYTRKAEKNVNVFRWRAPLYIAQVDRDSLRLIRSTEQIVLPLVGDGVNNAKHVARMGNFHTVNASPGESWVTVGETLPDDGWRGDTLMGRIRWSRPNREVKPWQ